MANVLSEEKRQQVLALGRLGWSLRRIEETTGIRRETASVYLRAAGIPIRPPRRWGRWPLAKPANEVSTDPSTPPNPANEVITDSATAPSDQSQPTWSPRPGRCPAASACEPFREFIDRGLSRGRNAVAIWQDLVTQHGFTAKYSSVMRFVRKLRGQRTPETSGIIETGPGEEGQVDYGEGPMVRHPETGKYRRTRLFVFTLGFSRKSVRLLVWRSSAKVWAQLHEKSFQRLGGAPRVVVHDNLREGVLKPDVYEPALNPIYRDVLAHYGVVALPCRVGDPDRKGKVESGVGHAQRTPLKGMRFESLEEAQTYLDQWEERWADTRIHGTTKRQVAAMFAEEKPTLLPLPVEPFRYYEFGRRTVHLDRCVEVALAYYAAAPALIGAEVSVQWDELRVRILDATTGQLLREHTRQRPGQHRYERKDLPARTPETTLELLARATRAGKHIGAVCERIHQRDGEHGVRRILGVLSAARKHGAAAVDHACAVALEAGVPTYRFVRIYLERKPPLQLTLRQVDPLIRELTEYRDLIQRSTTQGDESESRRTRPSHAPVTALRNGNDARTPAASSPGREDAAHRPHLDARPR